MWLATVLKSLASCQYILWRGICFGDTLCSWPKQWSTVVCISKSPSSCDVYKELCNRTRLSQFIYRQMKSLLISDRVCLQRTCTKSPPTRLRLPLSDKSSTRSSSKTPWNVFNLCQSISRWKIWYNAVISPNKRLYTSKQIIFFYAKFVYYN